MNAGPNRADLTTAHAPSGSAAEPRYKRGMEWFCTQVYCDVGQSGAATMWAGVLAFTGAVFAVLMAGVVGLRQTAIQSKQSEIQSKQAEIAESALALEELKLRSDLYVHRIEIFRAVQVYVSRIVAHGMAPGLARDPFGIPIDKELYENFYNAMSGSRFLFSKKGSDIINEIWDLSVALQMSRNNRDHRNKVGAPSQEEMLDREKKSLARIGEISNNLPEYFPELNLTARINEEELSPK